MLIDAFPFQSRLSRLKHTKCTLNFELKSSKNFSHSVVLLSSQPQRKQWRLLLLDLLTSKQKLSIFFNFYFSFVYYFHRCILNRTERSLLNLPQFHHASFSLDAPVGKWWMAKWPIRAHALLLSCYKGIHTLLLWFKFIHDTNFFLLQHLWTISKTYGGGGMWSAKKIFVEKIACTPRNPNIYSCTGPKKNSHKGSVNEKNSCGLKIPHPTPA